MFVRILFTPDEVLELVEKRAYQLYPLPPGSGLKYRAEGIYVDAEVTTVDVNPAPPAEPEPAPEGGISDDTPF